MSPPRPRLGPRFRQPPISQGAPLVALPRGEPVIELRVQTSRAVAGCVLCESPIGIGEQRMSMLLKLSEARQDKYGRNRVTERYNVHAGCLIDALQGPGEIRSRESCWDCGKKPSLEGGRWSFKAFTTTRFVFAPLCDDCVRLPRWRSCQDCGIYYPHWMVSSTRDDDELCDACSEQSGQMTRRRHEQDRDALAELRDQLIRDGLDET